jgi:branched-chain amino acid transport system substrate-binding protein
MRNSRTAMVLTAVLAAAGLWGCGDGASKKTGTGPGGDAGKGGTAGGEIRVGVIHPLSGDLAPYGKGSLAGIQMRVDEINAAGGVGGRKIKLLVEDEKGDPTAAVNAFNKLAGSDKVAAMIIPVTSTSALAVRDRAKELKVPSISPTATNDKVTLKNEYMFRACFNDSFQGRIVAGYAFKDLGIKTAAVFKDLNSDYSKGLAASFKKHFEALGGQVLAEESYQQRDPDFGAQLKKVKDSGAGLLFVPGYPPDVPLIIKQAKALGVTARLCGADGWDDPTVINGSGDGVAGCFLVGAFAREDGRPAVKRFVEAFTKRGGAAPGTFEASGYDSMSLLAEAMKKGTTRAEIRDGLAGIKGFEAVTGTITIDPEGDAVKGAVILEIQKEGDKFVTKYKATVNP